MPRPAGEIRIDAALVKNLLAEQHPDLAGHPLRHAAGGWDNEMWRLGNGLAVRLPRREAALGGTRNEHRWLPLLASRLPVPVPSPVRTGVPGAGFPWPWSVVPWLAGTTAEGAGLRPAAVRALAATLHALHRPAPPDAPRSPYRGAGLAQRPSPLAGLTSRGRTPAPGLARTWARALAAPASPSRSWVHGDLHARNILVRDGDLAALIDWGDLGAADPAVDLSVLWTVLEPADHTGFCAAYGPVQGPLLDRARGWALVFGVIFAGLDDDPGAVTLGERALDRLQR